VNCFDAETMVSDLMGQHRLDVRGWAFKWFDALTWLGQADFNRRVIRLSRTFVELNDRDMVRDVVLHEIAHVLAGRAANHGDKVFQDHCKRLGCGDSARTHKARMPERPYQIVCESCQSVIQHNHRRRSQAWLGKRYCRACGPASLGKLRCTSEAGAK
jgi:predicted SprT family Zn-dependent metalloprotease